MAVNRERLLKRFLELTAVDSPSFHERPMADALMAAYEKLGVHLTEDDSAKTTGCTAGNLYGYLEGTNGKEPVLFSGHMDTVSPGIGKKAIVHEDGTITSDGTTVLGADDAAAIAVILEALEEILEEGAEHRPLEFFHPTAEEVYAIGSTAFDYSKIKSKIGYIPDLSDTPGGYSANEPSLLSYTVKVTGKAAHAGFEPEKGISAITAAALAIGKIPQGRINDHTTLNIGLIQGGSVTNAVPAEAVIRGEIRSTVHADAMAAYEHLADVFKEEAEKLGAKAESSVVVHLEAYEIAKDDPALLHYEEALAAVGLPAHGKRNFGGSDVNILKRNGVGALCIFNSMYNCHTTGEYAILDELVQETEIIKQLMR